MLNLLTENLIRMDTSTQAGILASLPEVYAALMADAVVAFPALRPYPRHAWHAFLVQLGAMAMHRAGVAEPPSESAEWTSLIRGLTPDWPDDEPWQLVVDDITKPAFMQPPAKSADKMAEYKSTVATPDELDLLVTAKNHDLKSAVVSDADADDWLFALVNLQTMEGFGGAGNYGISRMNGGLGSRPAFSLTPSTRPGAHARRDICALLEQHSSLLSGVGHSLLWMLPWDGTAAEALTLDRLVPLYIEVCRRVRLRSAADGWLFAVRTSSKAARINAKSVNGVTQDPWTPVDLRDKKGNKALTLPGGGFTYRRIVDYLDTAKFTLSALAEPTPAEQRSPETMQLVARAMVRGQGKTEGYHERIIPVRSKARSAMLRRGGTDDDFGAVAQSRIEDIGKVQAILKDAVATFIVRGENLQKMTPNERRRIRNEASVWSNKLDEIVDVRFFEDLQNEVEIPVQDRAKREQIRNHWRRNGVDGLIDHASAILKTAVASLPCPDTRRYKARVQADSVFRGRLRGNNGLPAAFADTDKENDKCPNSNESHPVPTPTEAQMPLFQ